MSLDLWGVPVFHEEFDPARESLFDAELDDLTSAYAAEKRAIKGFCNLGAAETDFVVSSDNLREDVVAQSTGSINRHRQIVCAVASALFGFPQASLAQIAEHLNRAGARVYSADANSALFRALQARLDPDLFTCSEFFGEDREPGEMCDGVRHEDLRRTSFADATFDLIITSEVFEHIPDPLVAEREVVRILRPGGVYCFTAPFMLSAEHDIVLADVGPDGAVRHFAEPQYHGDPLRPEEGILVYRIFSFADLKRRFESLGCRFSSHRFWSKSLGILGSDCWVHVVTKNLEDGTQSAAARAEAAKLSMLEAELSRTGSMLAESLGREGRLGASLSEARAQLGDERAALAEARRQLSKRDEVLGWVQTSRSWRATARLRRAQRTARRLGRRLNLPPRPPFRGELVSPAEMERVSGELRVEGWVLSDGAPVSRVEVFLDEFYLGTVPYGLERPHAAESPGQQARPSCGYCESVALAGVAAGPRELTVRVFDARGRQECYTRTVVVG